MQASWKSSEGLVVNFTHESDKSVLYQGFLIDGTEKELKHQRSKLSPMGI
jgi:hypothetical protein